MTLAELRRALQLDRPLPENPIEALVKTRAQLERLSTIATEAAESIHPGIESVILELIAKEEDLESKAVYA